jgi:hypothetical protein
MPTLANEQVYELPLKRLELNEERRRLVVQLVELGSNFSLHSLVCLDGCLLVRSTG